LQGVEQAGEQGSAFCHQRFAGGFALLIDQSGKPFICSAQGGQLDQACIAKIQVRQGKSA
jgi:hypothetical protein